MRFEPSLLALKTKGPLLRAGVSDGLAARDQPAARRQQPFVAGIAVRSRLANDRLAASFRSLAQSIDAESIVVDEERVGIEGTQFYLQPVVWLDLEFLAEVQHPVWWRG